MDRAESENAYPDPDVPQSATGPFYSNQAQLPATTAQHTPHAPPHAPMATMHPDHSNERAPPQENHFLADFGHGQPSTPQQLAQQGLEVNRYQSTPDTGAKDKKSKTSRYSYSKIIIIHVALSSKLCDRPIRTCTRDVLALFQHLGN